MSTISGFLKVVIAVVLIVLGAAGLINMILSIVGSGIEQQDIPREIFKFALYTLFILVGLKIAKRGTGKVI